MAESSSMAEAESSNQNPEKIIEFQVTPAIKLKQSIESLNDNEFNPDNVGSVDITEKGFEITAINSTEAGGLGWSDEAFDPGVYCHHTRKLDASLSSLEMCKYPVKKLADEGNGHQIVNIHHLGNGRGDDRVNGVEDADHQNNGNDGDNAGHNVGGNGNGNDGDNAGHNVGGNGNGNGNGNNFNHGFIGLYHQPQFSWYPPLRIQRYESDFNNLTQPIYGNDIWTNILPSRYDTWQEISSAVRQLWRQISSANNNINLLVNIELEQLDPNLDSWPGCIADFGWYDQANHTFVHYDWRLFFWPNIRELVKIVRIHGPMGSANFDVSGENGANDLLLQHQCRDRLPPIVIRRFQWNLFTDIHALDVIYTNLFADQYGSWQDFSSAIRELWQQITNNNAVAPEVAAMNPTADSWPGSVTDIGLYNYATRHFVRFDWQVNNWLTIRDSVNTVRVQGRQVNQMIP